MPDNIVGSAWVRILPDLSGFTAELTAGVAKAIKEVQGIVDAKPITLRVNIDASQAVAKIAALRGLAGGALGGSGGGAGFGTGVLASAAGDSGGGGGGALGGLLTADALQKILGVGSGSVTHGGGNWLPGIATAGAFSVLSMAGLGLEHVLFTIVGLIGSLTGAIAGGLLLAVGGLAVALTGMATDLAGIGQAAGDIKSVWTVLTQYQTEQQALAGQLPKTAAAQAALNTAFAGFAPAARPAVEAAALTGAQFHWMFDVLTAQAESTGAKILNQAMLIGENFLPTIGKFAAANMGIIQKDIQPLFAWLNTTGLALLNQVEAVFTANLPTTLSALTQMIEFILRTLASLSSTSGGFMKTLDRFFTYANSDAGWDKWQSTMATLISMFHTWFDFFKIAFEDIVDLFKLTAGLGTGIIGVLTQMLTQLHNWLNLTSTKDTLHNIFEIHKGEVLEILQLIPPLVEGLGSVYLTLAPLLTKALTDVLGVIVNILKGITSNAWGAWLIGIGLILTKVGLLGTALGILKSGVEGMFGLGGASSAGAGLLSGLTGGMKVFVTNWAMFGGEGTGIPAVVARGGIVGAAIDSVTSLAAAAAPIAAAIVVLLGGIAILNAISQHPNTSPTPPGPGTGGSLTGTAATQAAYAATWNALQDSSNAAYRTSALFQQNLQKDLTAAGVPISQVPADAKLIAQEFADGKIKTSEQLDAIIQNLGGTGTATAKTTTLVRSSNALFSSLEGIVGQTVPKDSTWFTTIENELSAMGLSFSKASLYADTLQSYIAHYGPLTTTQMLYFYDDAKNINLTAWDIWFSLYLANVNLQSLPASAKSLATGLANLAKTTNIRAPGGGLGFLRDSGGPINEPVLGFGLKSGKPWSFAANGATEYVLTQAQMNAAQGRAPRSSTSVGGISAAGRTVQIVQNFFNNTTKEFKQEIEANNARLVTALRSI